MEQFLLDLLENISTIDFQSVIKILIYALGAFWIVVLYWIWLDISERTSNVFVRILMVLLVLVFNIIGLVIYLLIRPNQTIEEIYWSDLEKRYLKYETSDLNDCPKCGIQLQPGYNYCPNCKYKIKIKCPNCHMVIDRKCKFCPSCGEEIRKKTDFTPETLPPKEVMEEQIQSTRDEVVEKVETQGIKYSTRKGVAVKIGEGILSIGKFFSSIFDKIKKKNVEKKSTGENQFIEVSNKQKSKKKRKRNKRRN